MITKEFHASRRELYAQLLEEGSIGFLFAGEEKQEAGDEAYPFSVYRNFYYLTGCEKPEAVYCAYRTGGKVKEALFIERPEEIKETFGGKMLRPREASELYGIQEVRYQDELESFIAGIMARYEIHTLWIDKERNAMTDQKDGLRVFTEKMLSNYPWLHVRNSYKSFAKMRRVKEKEEIALHRKACEVTKEGVESMLEHMQPGMTEGQIEAYFDFVLKSRNCGHAFKTIAAAGQNACVLHYNANSAETKNGDLILFDLGASAGYYGADVSRTYPVNGKFTERQKQLYEIVLKGLDAALEAAKPGYVKEDLQKLSKKVMAEELIRIGMIQKEEEIAPYYLHGSGHFIGLYVHDVGEEPSLTLKEDMMYTLEPGLYFAEEGIGIRIEETILVKKDCCEVLTESIPKRVEDIERFMKERNQSVR